MLCYGMLCYVMLCYGMLCYVMLCYVMLCYVAKIKVFSMIEYKSHWISNGYFDTKVFIWNVKRRGTILRQTALTGITQYEQCKH